MLIEGLARIIRANNYMEIPMPEVEKSMFARGVDFKLEKTENAYIACRALSIRARHINAHAKEEPPENKTDWHNPTVGALIDYSRGQIDLSIPQRS